MVIMAGGMAGMSVARGYSRRPYELRCLQSALQMLETEITYTATPLPEALSRVAGRSDKMVAGFFKAASEELQNMSGNTASEAWEIALKKHYPSTALLPTDLAILSNLGGSLGISDRMDQSKHLQLAMEQLSVERNKAEESAAKNVKMWNYMGFMFSLVVVLMLI